MNSPLPSTPRFLPRFSLLTILLVMALVACSLTIWRLSSQLRPLKDELALIRKETRALDIRDRSKVHAIQMPADAKFTRKWRIWIPPGKQTMICFAHQGILVEGLPASQGGHVVRPGEYIVEWSYAPELHSGKWQQSVKFDNGEFSSGPYPPPKWFEWGLSFAGATEQTTVEGAGLDVIDKGDGVKRVLIQRLRFSDDPGRMPHEIDGPLPGIVLWLEQT